MGKAVLFVLLSFVFGAGGACLRYFQLAQAFEASGLQIVGHPMTVSLIVLSLFFAALIAALMLWFGMIRTKLPKQLSLRTRPFDCAVGIISAAVLAASGVFRYLDAGIVLSTLDISLIAAAAVGFVSIVVSSIIHVRNDAGAGYSAMIPVLVFCLNLVTAFKAWGSDPVLLHYTYRILVIVFAVLASYSYAGASFNYTRPGLGIFSSTVGIYLAAICLVDDLPWADRIFFAFCIVYMVMVAVTQIRYLQRAKEEIEKELMID